jgi:hypothetical protein
MATLCDPCVREIIVDTSNPLEIEINSDPSSFNDWEIDAANASAAVWTARLSEYPEDIVARISELWFSFPYPTADEQRFVIGILSVLFVSGAIGNVGVIYMFFA